jgi:inorganic phosphate transporter, PiT family
MEILCILLTLSLAAANGANDNGKGVATLAGANIASYKKALLWANLSTLSGALLSGVMASRMLKIFSSGIVSTKPTAAFTLAVLVGVSSWVAIATFGKLPVSTTHGIVGALIGAGLIFSPASVSLGPLFARFALPLFLSIVVSYLVSATLNYFFRSLPQCTCVQLNLLETGSMQLPQLNVVQSTSVDCKAHNSFIALHVDQLHWVSSGLVGFGRGLNDTPKIVAIAVAGVGLAGLTSTAFLILVSLAMFAGGMAASRRIARRMGEDIVKMDAREGALANLTTSMLLALGANLGWPMSTTHVSSGAITGVVRTEKSRLKAATLRDFVIAWIVTPPVTGLIAIASYLVITRISSAH